ncbi:MAG TPA: HAMP domain-containing sensor histidine kinase [Alkalispirochaeta sp.]|nr:HAMP domain-containing sensor histidine kinase [Alkalispirochaeta sp.]
MKSSKDLLRSAYFFRNLDDTVLQAVAERCAAVQFDQGAIIFQEGDQGDRLFIVLSGEVEVWKHAHAADASLLSRYGVGRFFGEMALVDELPRSATAVAATSSELLSLQRSAFAELVEAFPQLAASVMRSLSAIVRESNDSFVADLHHRNQELESAYRQLERAQQELLQHERLSNLGKMSNMILHDIRNPVAVLKGYAQALASVAADPARVTEIATRIDTEAARLGHLSGELLDYARGEVRLDLSVIAPSRIIEEARIYVDEHVKGSDITLTVTVLNDTPFVADHQRMVRAVFNLLDNARIACRNGGRIEIQVSRTDNMVEFSVEDTGEGMSEATAARMFEPFFTTSNRGGTGLGTVIVRNIVEAHGGSLFVASREGVGTKVTARVPAALTA